MCDSAKFGAEYMDTLESGQMHGQMNYHIKAEPTSEEIVTNPRTNQPDKLQDLHDKDDKYYVYDSGYKPESNSKVYPQIPFDSLSPHSKDDTTSDSSSPLAYASPENLITSSATIPPDVKQLLFLYDCETTGLSHYDEHIIEIGSVVILPDNLSITQIEFSSLCHTSRQINPRAFMKHGITTEMLVGQPSFSIVFNRLLEWIKQCTKEACSNNDLYYPVLVAHNGFPFHYYVLMAEINRHNLEQSLKTADLWFADTLYDARRFLKASSPIFNNWSQQEPKRLGLVSLFHKFFPEEAFGDPRRVMEDIQAMRQVFTTTALTPIFENLTIKTKEEIWKNWYEKWNARHFSDLAN